MSNSNAKDFAKPLSLRVFPFLKVLWMDLGIHISAGSPDDSFLM